MAIGFAVLALVLLVVVGFQAWMLHSRAWLIALGTLPEWVAAVGTGIAAFGVLAAFGTLRIGRREWEMAQAERRDQLANQARLIVVEAVPPAEMVPPANLVTPRPDGLPEYRYVVIRNHSQQPVFNVRIPDKSPKKTPVYSVTTVSEVVPQEDARGSVLHPEPTIIHRGPPRLRACACAWPSNISTPPRYGAAQ